jgi:uncharacterized protein
MKLTIVSQPCATLLMSSRPIAGTRTLGLYAMCVLALLVLEIASATAQGPTNTSEPGITVEGTGEIRTVPDVVEINVKLNARGELTDDAVVKHKDSRKRTLETFQALKLDNLKLQEKDLSLRPGNMQEMMQMMWNGMPPSQNKRTPIEVGSTLQARLVEIDKMPTEELMTTIGRLLDAAQDAGAGLGMADSDMMNMRYYGYSRQTSLVKFIVTNVADIREKAYEMAVKDARRRAERLARLNDVTLGAVLAVHELATGGGRQLPYYYGPIAADSSQEDKTEIMAETLSGGLITVRLRVRFGIVGRAAQADASGKEKGFPVAAQNRSP